MQMLPARRAQYVAVVRAADGVRFAVSAPSAAERSSRIAAYIGERCEYTLWPDTAVTVKALIAAGDADGAVAAYFANVGQRWDEEWLELQSPERGELPVRRTPPRAAWR